VPVAQVPEGRQELTPQIKFGKTPEGKSLRFVHKDSYDEIDGTYETITAYLDAKDIVAKDAFIEEYVTELTDSTDANLEVNIYVQPKE
jgi:effector-binding domain-containing protein